MNYTVKATAEELSELEALSPDLFRKIPEEEKNSEFIASESTT